jgi:hypothetical protein
MPIVRNTSLARLKAGQLSIGFGAGALRTRRHPEEFAKAAGFDWLFIDMEHGAISVHEATQLCHRRAADQAVTPIVRVLAAAPSTKARARALDNGALGVVVPHVDTARPGQDGRRRACASRRAAPAPGAAPPLRLRLRPAAGRRGPGGAQERPGPRRRHDRDAAEAVASCARASPPPRASTCC